MSHIKKSATRPMLTNATPAQRRELRERIQDVVSDDDMADVAASSLAGYDVDRQSIRALVACIDKLGIPCASLKEGVWWKMGDPGPSLVARAIDLNATVFETRAQGVDTASFKRLEKARERLQRAIDKLFGVGTERPHPIAKLARRGSTVITPRRLRY